MLTNNEQNDRKSRNAALAGTLLFHALILVVLLLLAFHTNLPLPPEDGVEVNFEFRGFETDSLKPVPILLAPQIIPPADQKIANEHVDTKIAEKTLITTKDKTVKPIPSKSRISIVETPEESTIIHKELSTGKTTKTSPGDNQETTQKPGEQAINKVKSPIPINEGSGSNENAISFDLGGRGVQILPKPAFNSQEGGKIVVSIKVNIEGKVMTASAGAKGTTIADPNLRKQAENAARNSIFARDTDAPEEQRGTITYVFVKQK